MAANYNPEAIQAIIVGPGSFVGVAANKQAASKPVTLLAQGDITFHFLSGDVQLTGIAPGMTFVPTMACTGVTSTVNVLIS